MAKGIATFRSAMHEVMSPFGRTLPRRSILNGAFACYKNDKDRTRIYGVEQGKYDGKPWIVREDAIPKELPPQLPMEYQRLATATEDIGKIEDIAQTCIDKRYFGVAKICCERAIKLLNMQPVHNIEKKAGLLNKLIISLKGAKEGCSSEQKKTEIDRQIVAAEKELGPIKSQSKAEIRRQVSTALGYQYKIKVPEYMQQIENILVQEGPESLIFLFAVSGEDVKKKLVESVDPMDFNIRDYSADLKESFESDALSDQARNMLIKLRIQSADELVEAAEKMKLAIDFAIEGEGTPCLKHIYFKSMPDIYKIVLRPGEKGKKIPVICSIDMVDVTKKLDNTLKGTFVENLKKGETLLTNNDRSGALQIFERIKDAKVLKGEELASQDWPSYKFDPGVLAYLERYGLYKDIIYNRLLCPENCIAVKFGNKINFYFTYRSGWYKLAMDTGSSRIFGLWKVPPDYLNRKKQEK